MNFFLNKPVLVIIVLALIGAFDLPMYAPVYSPGVAERIIKNALVEVKKTGTIKNVAQFKQAYQDLPRMSKENYQEDYEDILKALQKSVVKKDVISKDKPKEVISEKTGKEKNLEELVKKQDEERKKEKEEIEEEKQKQEKTKKELEEIKRKKEELDRQTQSKEQEEYKKKQEALELQRKELEVKLEHDKQQEEINRKKREENEKERIEKEKQEKERLEQERVERERLEKLEKERLEKERLEKENLEKERLEKERLEKEKKEKERLEKGRIEQQRVEKEKQQQEPKKEEIVQENLNIAVKETESKKVLQEEIAFLIQNGVGSKKIVGFACVADKDGNIIEWGNIADYSSKMVDQESIKITLQVKLEFTENFYVIFSAFDKNKKNVISYVAKDNKTLAVNLTQLSKKNRTQSDLIILKPYFVEGDIKTVDVSFNGGQAWQNINDL